MRKASWLFAALLAAILPAGPVAAQATGTVAGQVVDQETQQPVAGAQVRVAGTNLGALSNAQGRFVLTGVPTGTRTVLASRLGYKEASAQVDVGTTTATVTLGLQIDVLGLDEVVVVGYGQQRRRNVAGAISSVRPSETVADLPTPTVDNVLQGRVAGVQVSQNSGNPGAAISVRVRGASSISAGNQPLYVIDGVPMNQGNLSGFNGTFGGQDVSALSDLDPNNIESIEVLKDASAAAIYGARASNGVVLITTKRGQAMESPQITFNSYYGVQREWRRVEYLKTDDYMQVYNEGLSNRFGQRYANFFGYEDDGVENFVEVERGTYTDWMDEVLKPAPIASLSGSISGGSERARYHVSGSHFNQDGIVDGFGYERLNGRLNLDYSVSDKLNLGTNVGLSRSRTLRSRGDNTIFGPFANANAIPPHETVYDENGEYTNTLYANPVGLAKENEAYERSIRILGNAFATYEVLPGITARASVGLDQVTNSSRLYDSPVVGVAVGSNGSARAADRFVNKLTYEGTLSWLRDIGADHNFSGVVGTSYEHTGNEFNSVTGTTFPTEYFRYLTSAATITDGTSSYTDWSLLSLFSRASYTYANRYTATFNIRTDGSSRFGEENRFGVFPSASLLWRVSDEAFMQSQDVVSDLAVRLSYGRTGNQAGIGDFAARGLFGGGNNYGDEPGTAPAQLANPALKWETTDQFNVGGDVAFLDDRLSVGLDYYVKDTNDLLVGRPVPRTTGFRSIWSNIGSMRNTGVELVTKAQLARGATARDFSWTAEFNLARNRNEVTSLLNDEPMSFGFGTRVEVGQPLGVFYGYQMDGIFRSQEEVAAHAFQNARTAPGDIRFKDRNGDGKITADDRTIIGSPWPDFTGGLTNQLSFAGVDLNVFLQFSKGNDVFNAMRTYSEAYGSYFDNHTLRALDRWTPENPDATEPRAVWGDPNGNARTSDRFIEDGSYLRIKNAVLGYTLPRELAARLGFGSARVYLQGQNLVTFTKYSGWDPEVNAAGDSDVVRGVDFYTLPQARTLTAGINVSF